MEGGRREVEREGRVGAVVSGEENRVTGGVEEEESREDRREVRVEREEV